MQQTIRVRYIWKSQDVCLQDRAASKKYLLHASVRLDCYCGLDFEKDQTYFVNIFYFDNLYRYLY